MFHGLDVGIMMSTSPGPARTSSSKYAHRSLPQTVTPTRAREPSMNPSTTPAQAGRELLISRASLTTISKGDGDSGCASGVPLGVGEEEGVADGSELGEGVPEVLTSLDAVGEGVTAGDVVPDVDAVWAPSSLEVAVRAVDEPTKSMLISKSTAQTRRAVTTGAKRARRIMQEVSSGSGSGRCDVELPEQPRTPSPTPDVRRRLCLSRPRAGRWPRGRRRSQRGRRGGGRRRRAGGRGR